MVQLAPFNPAVPMEVKGLVVRLRMDLAAGRFSPFQGPVIAQDGTVKVAKGRAMPDQEIAAINYFVQGVSSPMPKQ